MKKVVLIFALVIGGLLPSLPVWAAETAYSTSRDLPDDARYITVYKVVQVGGNAWSTSSIGAYYSASENCIYVDEGARKNQSYSVMENRAYGQSNDGRAEFRYEAGGYYFNL